MVSERIKHYVVLYPALLASQNAACALHELSSQKNTVIHLHYSVRGEGIPVQLDRVLQLLLHLPNVHENITFEIVWKNYVYQVSGRIDGVHVQKAVGDCGWPLGLPQYTDRQWGDRGTLQGASHRVQSELQTKNITFKHTVFIDWPTSRARCETCS